MLSLGIAAVVRTQYNTIQCCGTYSVGVLLPRSYCNDWEMLEQYSGDVAALLFYIVTGVVLPWGLLGLTAVQ
jgi:hypothetical protein